MPAEKESASPWKLPYPTSAGEVKNGATDIEELALRLTTIFKERFTTVATHNVSFAAASGELVQATAAITVTLPAVAENAIVSVLANNHAVKIKTTAAAKIYGDAVTGAEEINLVGYQHVVLVSDGTNWFIIAGEPKRESAWKEVEKERVESTGFTASETRPSVVILYLEYATAGQIRVLMGGGSALTIKGVAGELKVVPLPLDAGKPWQWEKVSGTVGVRSTYVIQ